MAKWSGVYLEDCHTLLKKIEKELEKEIKKNDKYTYDDYDYNDVDDLDVYLFRGRRECAKELQDKIKKWRKEMYNE